MRGRFFIYGANFPNLTLPGFMIVRGHDALAIAVSEKGERFCISRDEATLDWTLHKELGPRVFNFETAAYRFSRDGEEWTDERRRRVATESLTNVQNVSLENEPQNCG